MALRASRIAAAPAHSAGIFADRNLDGPEIGTLVVVVDRAKNLPNLRTMGKQDPYCAARLGKTAKKTETDRRGGQTPRWDQELRFCVYESLDYTKLKVSVFNEEKRTDLIGETWINLEEVIRRGGGQSDAWHELNAKGKYAGQIRIELTYYDTRPKEDPAALTSSHTMANGTSQDGTPHAAGPRQPGVKRRPLTAADGPMAAPIEQQQPANGTPTPQTQPRSYHTPPPQDSSSEQQGHASHNAYESPYDNYYADAPANGYDVNSYYNEPEPLGQDASFGYSDDAYALQAVHAGGDQHNQPMPEAVAPLRHDRVQRLSNATPSRPIPQGGLPHAYSAPVLTPVAHPPVSANAPINPEWHSVRHSARYGAKSAQSLPTDPASSHEIDTASAPPPLPPTHRNSAPPTHSLPQQMPHPPPATYDRQPPMGAVPAYSQQPHHALPPNYNDYPERRRSEPDYQDHYQQSQYEPNARPQHTMRPQHDHMHYEPVRSSRDAATYGAPASRANVNASTPLYRPQAVSPSASARPSSSHIQRKSVSPRPSPATPYENGTTSVPFSPDSFSTFNPSSQHAPVAASPFEDSRQPSPMYPSRQDSTEPSPRTTIKANARPTTATASAPETTLPGSEAPIRDSRGRIVDPSDHLPSSTFAPEPEPKGADRARPSGPGTSRSFGPREARPLPGAAVKGDPSTTSSPASSPLPVPSQNASPRTSRLQKRNPAGYSNSSPLAPSGAAALNAGVRSLPHAYTQQHPPPIPGKVPLDAESHTYEQEHRHEQDYEQHQQHHDNSSTNVLSHEMSKIDIGLSPLQKFEKRFGPDAGGGAQRGQRRSRFGP